MTIYKNGWNRESVEKHVRDNFKGYSGDSAGCYYKHPDDDRRCAVGLFIPDDEIDALQTDGDAETLLAYYPELRDNMPLDDDLLMKWQVVHDTLDHKTTIEKQKDRLINYLNVLEKR